MALPADRRFELKLTLAGLLLVGLSLFIWGGLCVVYNDMEADRDERAGWPVIQGTVLTVSEETRDDNVSLDVTFSYAAGDAQFEGRQSWIAGEDGLLGPDSRLALAREKYVAGATIDVYVRPGRPEEAVVEPLGVDDEWRVYTFGLGFLVGFAPALVGLSLIRRSWARRRPSPTT